MLDADLDVQVDDVIDRLEECLDTLRELRERSEWATRDAKHAYSTAMLEAIAAGAKNAEERKAKAELASIDLFATAAIHEREYRDTLTAIHVLRSRLDMLRSTMVTQRQIQV